MGRNTPNFMTDCPECGAPMTLNVTHHYSEMYCKECGFSEDPRVQFRDKSKGKTRFKNQREQPLL